MYVAPTLMYVAPTMNAELKFCSKYHPANLFVLLSKNSFYPLTYNLIRRP